MVNMLLGVVSQTITRVVLTFASTVSHSVRQMTGAKYSRRGVSSCCCYCFCCSLCAELGIMGVLVLLLLLHGFQRYRLLLRWLVWLLYAGQSLLKGLQMQLQSHRLRIRQMRSQPLGAPGAREANIERPRRGTRARFGACLTLWSPTRLAHPWGDHQG